MAPTTSIETLSALWSIAYSLERATSSPKAIPFPFLASAILTLDSFYHSVGSSKRSPSLLSADHKQVRQWARTLEAKPLETKRLQTRIQETLNFLNNSIRGGRPPMDLRPAEEAAPPWVQKSPILGMILFLESSLTGLPQSDHVAPVIPFPVREAKGPPIDYPDTATTALKRLEGLRALAEGGIDDACQKFTDALRARYGEGYLQDLFRRFPITTLDLGERIWKNCHAIPGFKSLLFRGTPTPLEEDPKTRFVGEEIVPYPIQFQVRYHTQGPKKGFFLSITPLIYLNPKKPPLALNLHQFSGDRRGLVQQIWLGCIPNEVHAIALGFTNDLLETRSEENLRTFKKALEGGQKGAFFAFDLLTASLLVFPDESAQRETIKQHPERIST